MCAIAGVCIQRGFGIAPDFVLFQPTVTTLAIPLAEFANPDKAVEGSRRSLRIQAFLVTRNDAATACRSRSGGYRSGNGRRDRAYTVWLLTVCVDD